MGKDQGEKLEKLYGELLNMEKDIKDIKEILKDKSEQSPKVGKMYRDLESTEKSVKGIKGTIDKSKGKQE